MSKMLIVYYSQAMGNTKRIAQMLQEETNADIAQIDTVIPYTGSYNDIVAQGQNEANRGYKPEIKPLTADFENYDIIAVGTPTWWYTMAPAVLTFLSSHNWNGKTVVPFMTDGGWPGHVMKDIRAICIGADIKCAKEIQFDSTGGDKLETSVDEINSWINDVKELIK